MGRARGAAVAVLVALLAPATHVAESGPDAGPVGISGTVRDFAGKPVPHVAVRCAGTFPSQYDTCTADVVTDAAGRYEVRGLGRGRASLFLLSESGVGDGAEREFEWERPVTVDFTVHGELELAGRVGGQEPGPFDVELDRRQDAGAGAWHDAPARRQRVGIERVFEFRALRPGLYTLRVAKDGRVRSESEVEVFASVAGREVALDPARTASLDVRATAAWPETPSFVSVAARPARGGRRDTVHAELVEGVHRLTGLAPGTHWVQVRHVFGFGETSESEDRWFPVDGGSANGPLTLACGPAEDVRIALVPPRERPTVEGRVVVVHGPFESATPFALRRGADGKPAVWRVPPSYPGMPPGLRKEPVPAPSLPLPDVVRGAHRVRVEAVGCEPVERWIEVAGPTAFEVPLVALPGRVAILPDEAQFPSVQHLRVEARRDEPGAEWKEILWMRAWPRGSHSPVPGTFHAFLAPGRWLLRATCDRHGDAALAPVDVEAAGPPLPLALRWTRGVAVSGRLTIHGLPLEDGWVYPHRLENKLWRALPAKEVFVDEGGTYRIEGLSPGRYRFAHTDRGRPVLGETDVLDRDVTLDLAVPSALPPRPR
jgi:hypothetical protein